jgi:hypothetical protein
MKFKLDENLPRELADDLPRLLLQAARTAGRVLLALDKGIASLLQHPIHELAGVVLFRPDTAGVSSFVRARPSALLEMELAGRLTVVGSTRIRVR